MDNVRISYKKPALTTDAHIALLRERGLIISDPLLAAHYLNTIGYYCLSAYFKPFEQENTGNCHQFRAPIEFSDVLNLYIFDRELRLLVSDALERIEVAFRTSLSNVMSIKYGPLWYQNEKLFKRQDYYKGFWKDFVRQLDQSQETFIRHYYSHYDFPDYPPSWMIIECLSFGLISKLFHNLADRSVRKQIGDVFGQFSETMKSWMQCLTYVRNLCAHHARLWNRTFVIQPVNVPRHLEKKNQGSFYAQAYIISKLLDKIAPGNHWKARLYQLFEKYSAVSISKLGFLDDWKNDPFWKE
jgi:abortive infection bacteriophage resistance protein